MNTDELRRRVSQHVWFHSIDLGDGIVTPGKKKPEFHAAEAKAIFDPIDVKGRTLMDVGAWNGFYTVEAKRRGAADVLAVDEITWNHPDYRAKETFDLVMSHLGLNVQTRAMDAHNLSEKEVGRWDVVLCLGVFYHLVDPILVVQRLAEITNEVLVLETWLDAQDIDRPAMIFYPGTELIGDPTNWWGPNRACVEALLRMAGFTRIIFSHHPMPSEAAHRGIFHAFK